MEENVKNELKEETKTENTAADVSGKIYNIKFSETALNQLWAALGESPANKVMDLMLQIRHQYMIQERAFATSENEKEEKQETEVKETEEIKEA